MTFLKGRLTGKCAIFNKLQTTMLYEVFLEHQISETVGIISGMLFVRGGCNISLVKVRVSTFLFLLRNMQYD